MRCWFQRPRTRGFRRGIAAVLVAVLLPVFIGMLALSADVAVLAVAQSQMGTAADAAALAGAWQLATEQRVQGVTDLSTEISAANTEAIALASDNRVLSASPVVNANTSNQAGGQVLVGFLDPTNPTATLNTSSSWSSLYNSVQVTILRDASHGGPVPTVFAQLMGFKGSDMTVSSTATAQTYSINGFRAVGSLNANLLPIVLDKDTWLSMMTRSTTDQYTYDSSTNTVTSGADGVYESLLYPASSGSPGNWGTIEVGVSNNSASILSSQIQNGITPSQLSTYPNNTIELDPTQNPPSITFSGNPGISAGIKSSLEAIIGKPVAVPIYDEAGGNGSNAWYRVVAFQPARVLALDFQGNPKYLIIQPCLLNDRTAIAGTPQSWSWGGLISLQLTR